MQWLDVVIMAVAFLAISDFSPYRCNTLTIAQQRFRTWHADAAAGFVCVRRCLGSDYVLLIVVEFC
jgi:hypothetical protein